ncbi:hypothetical protein ABIB82_002177 [Bradyrhizobium sp. i1.8.4]
MTRSASPIASGRPLAKADAGHFQVVHHRQIAEKST